VRATTSNVEAKPISDAKDIIGKIVYYNANDTVNHPVEKLMG